MKKVCFILAVLMILSVGLASMAAAYTPTLPPQARASQHSRIHADNTDTDVSINGIIMGPVGEI